MEPMPTIPQVAKNMKLDKPIDLGENQMLLFWERNAAITWLSAGHCWESCSATIGVISSDRRWEWIHSSQLNNGQRIRNFGTFSPKWDIFNRSPSSGLREAPQKGGRKIVNAKGLRSLLREIVSPRKDKDIHHETSTMWLPKQDLKMETTLSIPMWV